MLMILADKFEFVKENLYKFKVMCYNRLNVRM